MMFSAFNHVNSSNLGLAATNIVQNVYVGKSATVYIIISANDADEYVKQDIISTIVHGLNGKIAHQLEDVKKIKEMRNRNRFLNIVLIDNFKSFQHFFKILTPDRFEVEGFYLVIWIGKSITESLDIFQPMAKLFAYNVNLLVQNGSAVIGGSAVNDTAVSMFTIIPFSNSKCNNLLPVEINRFENGSFTDKKSDYFPKKFKNFYKCSLKAAVFQFAPAVMQYKSKNGSTHLEGSDVELLNGLSDLMNFEIDFVFLAAPGSWGVLYENGTSTGAIKRVMENSVDLTVGLYSITYIRTKFMSSSESYHTLPMVLIIPPGAPYSKFEKLFQPFEGTVWLCLIVTFSLAFLIIAVVQFQPKRVIKDYIIGRTNSRPYLNIIEIFLGGCAHGNPSINFTRVLLMIFILFCLVIRSLYQGSLFTFMQMDNRAKEVQSIDEMMAKGFDFYMYAIYQEHTRHTKFFPRYFSKFLIIIINVIN